MTARFWSRDAGCSVLAAALAALPVLPALLRPARLVYPTWSEFSDLTLIHWPKALLIRGSLAEGTGWPLWSPYALSGQPLAANQLAMLFYPPALLLLAGPLAWSFSLFYALHLAWAAIGTYWLVRGLGRRPAAALVAAAIFALGGKLIAHVAGGHVSLVAAVAWVPWAFAFLHRALDRRSTGYALLAGVALAAQAATHTYALVYTAYGLALYTLLYLALAPGAVRERGRAALRLAPRLALIPVVALLLGAAQLLPLAEMAPYSNRALDFKQATLFSLSIGQTLTGLLFPTPNVGHEWIFYPGLLTLGLAAGAWPARHERPVLIYGILAALGILLALGSHTPLYRLAYTLLPGLRWMRTPARLWFFVTLGLAVLAAYGFEWWQDLGPLRAPRRARHTVRLVLVAATVFALALSLGVVFSLGQTGRGAWGLGLFGLLTGALLLWATARRPTPLSDLAFVALALLVVVADLLSFGYTLLRFVPQAEVAAKGRAPTAWLAGRPGPFRVYSPSYSLPQPAVSEAGLQQIDGVEPVHLAAYDRFMARAGGYGEASFGVTIPPFPEGVPIDQAHRETQPDLRLLGMLDGRYLATAFPLEQPGLTLRWHEAGQGAAVVQEAEAETWIYENEQALPRAYVVHQAQVVDPEEAWQRLAILDPTRTALVEGGTALSGAGEPTPARITAQSPNQIVVETDLEIPGLLVLSEIWYPGWQARVDGVGTPIWRTNTILRGVYLDAGLHAVEFRYVPRTVRAGLAISAAALLILLLYAGLRARAAGSASPGRQP